MTRSAGVLLLLACMLAGADGPVDPAAYDHPVRVACVGDSITRGVGCPDPATQSYPARLQQLLGAHWQVDNFGVGGRTLLRKQDALDIRPALDAHPDVVVIMLGTNDSRQTTWDAHGGEFVGDYTGIIAAFRALPSRPRVWICAPVPMFPGQWGLSEEILTTRTIPAIRQVAAATATPLIDLHAALVDSKAHFPDLVHPDPTAAGTIAATVAAALTGRPR